MLENDVATFSDEADHTDPTFDLEAQHTGGDDDSPKSTPPRDWESLYKSSSTEAKRLRQQVDELAIQHQQMLNQVQQYMFQQQHQPKSVEDDDFTEADVNDLRDALFNNEDGKVKQILSKVGVGAIKQFEKQLQQQQSQNSEVNSSLQYIGAVPELHDAEHPLTKLTQKLYYEIVNNPVELAGIKNDTIPFGNTRINPHVLRIAVSRAKAQLGDKRQKRVDADRGGTEDFSVGVTSEGGSPTGGSAKFNPMTHLSKEERKYIVDMQKRGDPKYGAKIYWDNLEKAYPGIQAARLKHGRPVNQREFRSGVK